MILLAATAFMVGLVHSLAPGHWLPVVLVAKTRRWPVGLGVTGALAAASGHVLVSVGLGVAGIAVGAKLFLDYEHQLEKFGGLGVAAFGLIYAVLAYTRHARCAGHTHHGPEPTRNRGPFVFLFLSGFSPCVAVLPVFITAAPLGAAVTAATMAGFALGVISALVGASTLVTLGVAKLDHPVLEHYGDVITGLGVVLMGLLIFVLH